MFIVADAVGPLMYLGIASVAVVRAAAAKARFAFIILAYTVRGAVPPPQNSRPIVVLVCVALHDRNDPVPGCAAVTLLHLVTAGSLKCRL